MLLLALAPALDAYSVLTHEAIVDSAWEDSIKPVLLALYPTATPDQLTEAHAYAYGGCIVQDMGYYPFGSKLFSDLVHYVRSGDFVVALVRQARDLDEHAFALGALAHYTSDTEGHPLGVNPSVPLLYPKLARKYGNPMTYAQNPAAHLKTEFGFDVLQVARGNYATKAYHDFIGFEVAKPLLERAFAETYGLELKDVFKSLDLALGSYRRAVSTLIPESTKIAWQMKKDEIVKATPGITARKFRYNLSRASYEKEWGRQYERPGVFARVLAALFRALPKVGPFRALSFKTPNEETSKLFMLSFNRTLDRYRILLKQAAAERLRAENLDLDTGQVTAPRGVPPGRRSLRAIALQTGGQRLRQHIAGAARGHPGVLRGSGRPLCHPRRQQEVEQDAGGATEAEGRRRRGGYFWP